MILLGDFPQLFSDEQLSPMGENFALLLLGHFKSLNQQLDKKIETFQQHRKLITTIQKNLNFSARSKMDFFLQQMQDTLGEYNKALADNKMPPDRLAMLLEACDRLLQEYYNELVRKLQVIIGSTIIEVRPGDLAYQAFTLLAALMSPEKFYLMLHPNLWQLGHLKNDLYCNEKVITLESALRVSSFSSAIFRKPKNRLEVIYQASVGIKKHLAFVPLTKGIILDCLDFLSVQDQSDSDPRSKIKAILESLYTRTEGDLSTPLSDYASLRRLLKYLPTPKNLFAANYPTAEQSIIIYLLKTAELYSLWQNPIDLSKSPTQIKEHIATVWNRNNLWDKITVKEYFEQILEESEGHETIARSFQRLKQNWAREVNQFQNQLKKEKQHLPVQQRVLDPIDALRMQQFVTIHHRLDEWKKIKETIAERYHNSQGESSAQDILKKAAGEITYATLFELSVYWQSNHKSITTLLRPGRWFSEHGQPRVMYEIDLLLQRFERNLAQKDFNCNVNACLNESDLKALFMIDKLYTRRCHIPYFKTSRSAEIIDAIEASTTFKDIRIKCSDNESLNELTDCYQFEETAHKDYFVSKAESALRKKQMFFARESDCAEDESLLNGKHIYN